MTNAAQPSSKAEARRPYAVLQAINTVQGRVGLCISLCAATLVIVGIALAPRISKTERWHQLHKLNVIEEESHTEYLTSLFSRCPKKQYFVDLH